MTQKFKNTFALHIKNTEFTISQIRGLIKLAALDIDSLPNDVLKALDNTEGENKNG